MAKLGANCHHRPTVAVFQRDSPSSSEYRQPSWLNTCFDMYRSDPYRSAEIDGSNPRSDTNGRLLISAEI